MKLWVTFSPRNFYRLRNSLSYYYPSEYSTLQELHNDVFAFNVTYLVNVISHYWNFFLYFLQRRKREKSHYPIRILDSKSFFKHRSSHGEFLVFQDRPIRDKFYNEPENKTEDSVLDPQIPSYGKDSILDPQIPSYGSSPRVSFR